MLTDTMIVYFSNRLKASKILRNIGLGCALFLCMITHAQTIKIDSLANYSILADNGLYLSAKDFTCGHLVFSFANRQANYRWKGLSQDSKATLINLDTTIQVDESMFWGYRINNKDYRFYNNETYQVIEHEEMIIYVKRSSGGDYSDIVLNYFSISAHGPILMLTRKNLVRAFSSNPRMVNALNLVKRPANWIKLISPSNRPLIIELYRLNR